MDNDILINQARKLYAALYALLAKPAANGKRLEALLAAAYCRYQRRLNRCALCYQTRDHDCKREPGEKDIPCKKNESAQDAA